MAKVSPEEQLEQEAIKLVTEQKELEKTEAELIAVNPAFGEFLQKQKAFSKNSKLFWKALEDGMIKHDVKTIKGDWGSITIAERTTYKTDDLEDVPNNFLKRALDTKKIEAYSKLKNKLPRGIYTINSKYLTKRIK